MSNTVYLEGSSGTVKIENVDSDDLRKGVAVAKSCDMDVKETKEIRKSADTVINASPVSKEVEKAVEKAKAQRAPGGINRVEKAAESVGMDVESFAAQHGIDSDPYKSREQLREEYARNPLKGRTDGTDDE